VQEAKWAVECLLKANVDVNVVSKNQSSPALISAVKKVLFFA